MAKKASTKLEAPSSEVTKSESPSLPSTEPTDQEVTDLVRQSHGGISRKMALRILTDRKQQAAG